MAVRELKKNIYAVGAIDWDRRIFDELIPLPDGTSYNSYIIKGSDKTALIDTVDPAKKDELLKNLKALNIKKLDYIVANHAEQDHSGSIPYILNLYPDTKVITNSKCKGFLKDLLAIDEEKFIVVNDGDTISLGNKTLEFIFTPWVHWPETMTTYLIEDKILFSCDFFGSHRATSHLFVHDKHKVIEDAKRYYAEIMMPFRNQIRRNIEKLSAKELMFIAPSHGPVHKEPDIILNAYKTWIDETVEKKILIPYVSMHDSTKIMVEFLTNIFIENSIEVIPINLPKADIGVLAMELVDTAAVIFATPYVLAGAHPSIVYAAYLINALRPKTKFISIIGSYGWGGRCVEQLKEITSNLKGEILEPVFVKGYPKKQDFEALKKLAKEFIERINML